MLFNSLLCVSGLFLCLCVFLWVSSDCVSVSFFAFPDLWVGFVLFSPAKLTAQPTAQEPKNVKSQGQKRNIRKIQRFAEGKQEKKQRPWNPLLTHVEKLSEISQDSALF